MPATPPQRLHQCRRVVLAAHRRLVGDLLALLRQSHRRLALFVDVLLHEAGLLKLSEDRVQFGGVDGVGHGVKVACFL